MKKWANELNRAFKKKEVQIAKKHMKKCSLFLAIKKMQIKTMLRFLLTPIRMAAIKNTTTSHVGEDVGEKEHSYTAGRNVN
jgi:hypothetical protein